MNLASLCFCLGKCVLHNGFTFFSSPLFADMMSAFNEFACQGNMPHGLAFDYFFMKTLPFRI